LPWWGRRANAPAGYDRIATPCGRCRQLILEAAHCARHDVRVLCSYAGAPDVARTSSAALLPYAFGPLYLERG
jgi:cytidine deaminase